MDDESRTASFGSTSASLIEQAIARDEHAWNRLAQLYTPLVYYWARQSGLQMHDAADVVQDVFQAVSSHLAEFRTDRPDSSFRGWLWTITRNKIRDLFRRRAGRPLAQGGTTAQEKFSQLADDASVDEPTTPPPLPNRQLPSEALRAIRIEFESRTWEAFWRATVDGQPAADIAADLEMSVAAVYQAKSRVLRRIRREWGDLPG